jgi:hypothetical protein
MGDGQGDVTPGDGSEWIGLGEAARRLGVSRAAVYGRVERGTLQSRPKGNRGLEVLWPPPQRHDNGKDDVALTVTGDVTSLLDDLRKRLDYEVVELRQRVGQLNEKLDAAQAQVADLRVELATAQGEVAAKDAVQAELRAQLAWHCRSWWRRWIGDRQ